MKIDKNDLGKLHNMLSEYKRVFESYITYSQIEFINGKLWEIEQAISRNNDKCKECNTYSCDHQEISPETGLVER